MHIKRAKSEFRNGPRHQKGMIATFIAVIVLVATLMAAVALMRSVDTSNTIAGSMAFRQGIVQEAERAYLAVKAPGMPIVDPVDVAPSNDNYGVGYSSVILPANSRPDVPDVISTPAWGSTCTAPCQTLAAIPSTANYVHYVVERLCLGPAMDGLPANTNACIVPGAVIKGGGLPDAGSLISTSKALAAYRLTVRVDGPKNTMGYVQTILR